MSDSSSRTSRVCRVNLDPDEATTEILRRPAGRARAGKGIEHELARRAALLD